MVTLAGCLSSVEDFVGDSEPELISAEAVIDETIISSTSYTVYLNAGDHLHVSVDEQGRLGATVSIDDPDGNLLEHETGIDETTFVHVAETAGTFQVGVNPDESTRVEVVIESYSEY